MEARLRRKPTEAVKKLNLQKPQSDHVGEEKKDSLDASRRMRGMYLEPNNPANVIKCK